MTIVEALVKLRNDLKTWVTNNLNALNAKIDEKTIPIDSELDITSANPVQNKAIVTAIDNLRNELHDHGNKNELDKITEGKVATWDAKVDANYVDTAVTNAVGDVITNDEIDEICAGTLTTFLDSISSEEVSF